MPTYNNPVNLFIQTTYNALPIITLGTAASAALSAGVNRYTSITLSNPMDAAKFTIAAALALIFNISMNQTLGGSMFASKLPFAALTAYGIHHIANPEKNIASFAKLTALTSVSLFLGAFVYILPQNKSSQVKDPKFSIDVIGHKMASEAFGNSWRAVAAACSAWYAAHSFRWLGLDPKVTMIFTAAASLLYYATKPLFRALEDENKNIPSQVLSLLSLTKVAVNMLKLDLPLYKQFAKACAVAGIFIAIFDPYSVLSLMKKKKISDD